MARRKSKKAVNIISNKERAKIKENARSDTDRVGAMMEGLRRKAHEQAKRDQQERPSWAPGLKYTKGRQQGLTTTSGMEQAYRSANDFIGWEQREYGRKPDLQRQRLIWNYFHPIEEERERQRQLEQAERERRSRRIYPQDWKESYTVEPTIQDRNNGRITKKQYYDQAVEQWKYYNQIKKLMEYQDAMQSTGLSGIKKAKEELGREGQTGLLPIKVYKKYKSGQKTLTDQGKYDAGSDPWLMTEEQLEKSLKGFEETGAQKRTEADELQKAWEESLKSPGESLGELVDLVEGIKEKHIKGNVYGSGMSGGDITNEKFSKKIWEKQQSAGQEEQEEAQWKQNSRNVADTKFRLDWSDAFDPDAPVDAWREQVYDLIMPDSYAGRVRNMSAVDKDNLDALIDNAIEELSHRENIDGKASEMWNQVIEYVDGYDHQKAKEEKERQEIALDNGRETDKLKELQELQDSFEQRKEDILHRAEKNFSADWTQEFQLNRITDDDRERVYDLLMDDSYRDLVKTLSAKEKETLDAQINKLIEKLATKTNYTTHEYDYNNLIKEAEANELYAEKYKKVQAYNKDMDFFEGIVSGIKDYTGEYDPTLHPDPTIYYKGLKDRTELPEPNGTDLEKAYYWMNHPYQWDFGNDTLQRANKYMFASDEQVDMFNKLYKYDKAQGSHFSEMYLEGLDYYLESCLTEYREMFARSFAEMPEGIIARPLTSFAKIGTGLLSTAGTLLGALGVEEGKNVNSVFYVADEFINNWRDQGYEAADKLAVKLFGENAKGSGRFLMQTVDSMADNIAAMLTGTKLTKGISDVNKARQTAMNIVQLIMSTEATGSTMIREIKDGTDPTEAAIYAVGDGVIEWLTERVSLEYIMNPEVQALRGKPKELLKYFAKTGIAEGSEEINAGLLNSGLDMILSYIGNHENELQERYNYLISEEKLSAKDATRQALKEKLNEIGMEGLAGFISGIGLGAGYYIGTARSDYKAGKNIRNENGGWQQIQDLGLGMKEGTESRTYAEELQAKQKKGQQISNIEMGRLAQKIMMDTGEQQAGVVKETVRRNVVNELIEKGVERPQAEQYARVISDRITDGNKLTVSERSLLAQDKRAIEVWKAYQTFSPQQLKTANEVMEKTQSQRSIIDKVTDLTGKTARSVSAAAAEIERSIRETKTAAEAIDNLVKRRSDLISEKYAETAKELLESDPEAKNNKNYLDDVMKVYLAAYTLETEAPKTRLSPETAQRLFEEARNEFNEKDKQRLKNQVTVVPGQGVSTFRDINDGTTVQYGTDEWTQKLKKYSKTTRNQLGAAAEFVLRMGNRMTVIDDPNMPDVYGFESSTGEITINLAGRDGTGLRHHVLVTLSHELTHWLEQNSWEGYKALRQYVVDQLKAKGENIAERLVHDIDNQNAVLGTKSGKGLTLNGAMAELVAKSSENLLSSETFRNEIAKTNPTLYNNIRKYVKNFIARVREAIDGMDKSLSIEAKSLLKDTENIARIWLGAREEALGRENAETSEAEEAISWSVAQINRMSAEELSNAYMQAVENNDTALQARLVEEAAERAGYTEKVYHGTDTFGFTEFDLTRSRGAVFVSYNEELARTYTKDGRIRNISQREIGDVTKMSDSQLLQAAKKVITNFAGDAITDIVQRPDGKYELRYYDSFENKNMRYDMNRTQMEMRIRSTLQEQGKSQGVYQLYAKPGNQLVIDAKEARANRIWVEEAGRTMTTRQIADWARAEGYDSVRINNIQNQGGRNINAELVDSDAVRVKDIGIFFNQADLKSADNIVYDDDGKIVPLEERFDEKKGDIRYSTAEIKNAYPRDHIRYMDSFRSQMEDYKNNPQSWGENSSFVVGKTPALLQKLGLPVLPVTINKTHIDYALNGTYTRKSQFTDDHIIDIDELEKLPEKLNEPIAVIKSNRPGRIVFYIDMKAKTGRTVVVPIEVNTQSTIEKRDFDAINLKTVHRNLTLTQQLVNIVDKHVNGQTGRIFYLDSKKYQDMLKALSTEINPGIHGSGTNLPNGLILTLNQSTPDVKPKYKTQIETENFKKWFKGSKVVDEDGKPLIVYHGTSEIFTVFDMSKGRSTMDIQGAFFSPYEIEAGGYGENVGEFYLSIKNPAPEGVAYAALNKYKGQNYAGIKAREDLIKRGYDGVQTYDEWIAFYPNQIKSATDNIGMFDERSNDYNYSVAQLDTEYMQAVENKNWTRAEQMLMDKYQQMEKQGLIGYRSPYFFNGDHAEIARQIKNGDPEIVRAAAMEMAQKVPENAVLIPMPPHNGRVTEDTDTMILARAISEITGSPVINALESDEHISRNYAKKNNIRNVNKDTMGFRQIAEIPADRMPVFIDNVVGGAVTAQAAHDAVGRGITLAYAQSSRAKIQGAKYLSVTRDANGEVIPLSQRMDPDNPSWKYSVRQSPDMEVNNFMMGLQEFNLGTVQEKTMLRQFKELHQTIGILQMKISDREKMLQKLNQKEKEQRKLSAYDRNERSKINNWLSNDRNRLDKLEKELVKVTSDQGYARLMMQQDNLMKNLISGRTAGELNNTIEAIRNELANVTREMEERAAKLKKLEASDAVLRIRTQFSRSGLKQIAAKLKSDLNSTLENREIENRLALIALKMKEGAFDRDNIAELGDMLVNRMRSSYDGYVLSELRGSTFTLSKSQLQELKATNRTLRDIQTELAGTGIRVTGKGNTTLDMKWSELCDLIPSLDPNASDKAMLDDLLRVIHSEKNSMMDPIFQDGGLNQVSEMILNSAQQLIPEIVSNPKSLQLIRETLQFVEDVSRQASEGAQAMMDIGQMIDRLQRSGAKAEQQANALTGDIGETIEYFNTLAEQSEAAMWKKERLALIDQLKSENTENLLKEQAKWQDKIEKDKAAREQMESNLRLRQKITTNVSRIRKLLINETDIKNIPEHMKSLAREMLGMIVDNDLIGRKISGIEKKDLIETKRVLDIMETQDGTFGVDDLKMIDDEEAQAMVFDALADLEDGIGFYNNRPSGNILANLQGYRNALEKISNAVSTITSVINAERSLSFLERRIAVADAAEDIRKDLGKSKFKGELAGRGSKAISAARETILYGNMTPVYFFKMLRNSGLNMIWQDMQQGENRSGLETQKARDYLQKLADRTKYIEWSDEKHEVLLGGMKRTVSIENMMELYAIWKREQTINPEMSQHLTKGGVFIQDDSADTGKLRRENTQQRAFRVTDEEITAMYNSMTDAQKEYLEGVVSYLSNEMSKLGNEASMRMYGIEKYKESYYFPMKVWDGVKSARSDKGITGTVENRSAHYSFTKHRQNMAKNALVIGNFTQDAVNHIVEMINYNTMAPGVENFNKVLNFQFTEGETVDDMTKRNMRVMFQESYGREALKYLETFMKDLNGGVVQDQRKTLRDRALTIFKKNAVAGSLSVAAQQPLSYIRAAMLINPKYLAQALSPVYWKGSYAEMNAHSGVAVIKDMGRFDMNFGQSAKDFITPETKKSAYSKISDALTVAPQLMDRMTWTRMWSAVKAEQAAQNPDMDLKSDEFMQKVADRFNQLMRETQVYDSVLVKSSNMRSPNGFAKLATSFMAEPTLSLNVLADAVQTAVAGEKGGMTKVVKAGATFLLSAVLQAVIKGLMSSGRTPDKKRTWLENFLNKLQYNLMNEANPATLFPGYSDIIEVLKKGELQDNAMSALGKLLTIWQTAQNAAQGNGQGAWRDLEDTVGQLAQLFTNVPAKNLSRDVRAIRNWILGDVYAPRETSAAVLKYQMEANWYSGDNLMGMLNVWLGDAGFKTTNNAYYKRLYEMEKTGNKTEAEKLKEYLKLIRVKAEDPEKTISSAVAKLAKHDDDLTDEQRLDMVTENSTAKGAGDYVIEQVKDGEITAEQARKKLKEIYPDKDANDIWWSVDRAEYKHQTGADDVSENYYRLYDAIGENRSDSIKSAVKQMLDHGMKKESIKNQLTKKYKQAYLDANTNGKRLIRDALQKTYKALGYTAADANKIIDGWTKEKKKKK